MRKSKGLIGVAVLCAVTASAVVLGPVEEGREAKAISPKTLGWRVRGPDAKDGAPTRSILEAPAERERAAAEAPAAADERR